MRRYREPYETIDYAKGGSQLKRNAGYAQPKLDAIRALAKRAASLDPNWMLQLDYTAIRSPVLILWGAQDIMMDPVAWFRLKNDIVNAPVRVQTVEQAGHLCLVDRPEDVAEALLDFIIEHRGAERLGQQALHGWLGRRVVQILLLQRQRQRFVYLIGEVHESDHRSDLHHLAFAEMLP